MELLPLKDWPSTSAFKLFKINFTDYASKNPSSLIQQELKEGQEASGSLIFQQGIISIFHRDSSHQDGEKVRCPGHSLELQVYSQATCQRQGWRGIHRVWQEAQA